MKKTEMKEFELSKENKNFEFQMRIKFLEIFNKDKIQNTSNCTSVTLCGDVKGIFHSYKQ